MAVQFVSFAIWKLVHSNYGTSNNNNNNDPLAPPLKPDRFWTHRGPDQGSWDPLTVVRWRKSLISLSVEEQASDDRLTFGPCRLSTLGPLEKFVGMG